MIVAAGAALTHRGVPSYLRFMLIRLTYASMLAQFCDPTCVEEIIDASAPANVRRGIAGILAVDGASVLQILEGPAAEVIALFDHIRADDRHHGIVELDRVPIDVLHFAAWGMKNGTMADVLMMSQSL